ncbi:subtilisin inhibitor CLSI-I-like isoform X3 [Dioscorea cayenensis subsp. rotundata]|uniref:Subtilisin inhibitor CLSI-I-like isoform X3 n=1 Tax=Dioscorea cayennensis subsp. rotundata TaxID=55577 RepID=A0AB40BVY3_DIOCR|nr:subtilisin inhibitor CLSI-I-like isoform X3 [Dioscorea cayenensis subsp. rotundata]
MKNPTLVLFLIFSILIMAEQKQGETGQQGSRRIGSGAKTEWPEAVGLTAEEAKAKIKEDAPGLNIQVIPPNNFVTMDYNTGRVRDLHGCYR